MQGSLSSLPIKIMPILGTRPEAVKVAPLINLLKSRPEQFDCRVCVTAQHREMLDQVLQSFGITPDYDLDIMQSGQTLAQITTRALEGVDKVLAEAQPDMVLVQGDTTTVFTAGLAASYHRIALGHIEAGLRTGDKFDPFPEEINRRLTGRLADLHFAPTSQAKQNLLDEGIDPENIYLTGNTVIDALYQVTSADGREARDPQKSSRTILVTTHRRENWGEPLEEIAHALEDILEAFPDTNVLLPMHKNPVVREPLTRILGAHSRVKLIEPPDYMEFVKLMESADLVLTDSGGVQEEAPALGLPVLVLRRTTERPEGVDAGTAKLVGTNRADIVREAGKLLGDPDAYQAMSRAANPYGDGQACRRIAEAVLHWAGHGERPQDFTL